jgi:hypothetical protein
MQNALNQLTQFLQQGISAIFRFVQMIWSWSIGEITRVFSASWQNWPLWKQIILVLIAAGVIWALFNAAKELWAAGERVVTAFIALLGVFVKTLPHVVLAGLIAFGGAWIVNNFNPASIQMPAALKEFTSR